MPYSVLKILNFDPTEFFIDMREQKKDVLDTGRMSKNLHIYHLLFLDEDCSVTMAGWSLALSWRNKPVVPVSADARFKIF